MISLFRRAAVYLVAALPAIAQSHGFATVTIKAARPSDPRNERVQVTANGDLVASAVAVVTLISYAYDVPINPSPRLSALPEWAFHENYDIDARAPANAKSAPRATPPRYGPL